MCLTKMIKKSRGTEPLGELKRHHYCRLLVGYNRFRPKSCRLGNILLIGTYRKMSTGILYIIQSTGTVKN